MSDPIRVVLPNGSVLDEHMIHQLSWGNQETGKAWFARLPEVLREYCDTWDVTLDPGIPAFNYNLVLFGTTPQHGSVVIKTSPPHVEVTAELDALSTSERAGIVRVYDADPSVSIMLQQRVMPGTSLENKVKTGEISDEDATALAAEYMKKFWTYPPEGARLIPLRPWFQAMYTYRDTHPNGDGTIPGELISRAISFAEQLLGSSSEPVMLHGDLNPGNILWDDTDGWTIIDPKGLIGPRGYDIGTWMINPYGLHTWPNLRDTLERRLDQFSDLLDIDRFQLWQWSIVHAVLSECWTLEGQGVEPDHLHALQVAQALMDLPGA